MVAHLGSDFREEAVLGGFDLVERAGFSVKGI
jgi:hypothetical protein